MSDKELKYQPKGGMCFGCVNKRNDCSVLAFDRMPLLQTLEDGTHIVRCTNYQRTHSDEPQDTKGEGVFFEELTIVDKACWDALDSSTELVSKGRLVKEPAPSQELVERVYNKIGKKVTEHLNDITRSGLYFPTVDEVKELITMITEAKPDNEELRREIDLFLNNTVRSSSPTKVTVAEELLKKCREAL